MNVQLIPSSEPLLASMPSGREYHTQKPFTVPMLDVDVLARMRAPPDPSNAVFKGSEEDSGSDEEGSGTAPVGAFPGTRAEYSGSNAYF